MLGAERAKELVTGALAMSRADQTEVILQATESALTRFANNAIHQNVNESNIELRVRVLVGKRTGIATTNDLSPDALKRTVETARVIAQLQPENPDTRGLPVPLPPALATGFFEQTAAYTPEARARAVNIICKRSKIARTTAAGAFRTDLRELVVGNSQGILAYHASTLADLHAVAMIPDDSASGYGGLASADVAELNPEHVAEQAIGKAQRGRHPSNIEPGVYTVLLEESAVGDMLGFFGMLSFHALAVQERRSFLRDRLGQRVMGENITIWDDGLSPQTFSQPFDFEGVPKQRVMLVENGIARGVTYDTTTAARVGKDSTGHALPAPNSIGPLPMHLFLAPGTSSHEELVRSVEHGILVTRFWYTRTVQPLQVVVTGTTRDGTFLIEKGEVTRPVRNLRFTTSYLDAMNQVRAVGRETRLTREVHSGMASLVPALVADGFHFTGVTRSQ